MRDPEQKHVISKRIPRGNNNNNNNVQKQFSVEETTEHKSVGNRRQGRRRGKGKPLMLEDSTVKISSDDKRLMFHRRPGFGQLGTKCVVKANHFLADLADMELTQYSVLVIPEVNSTKLNKTIMTQLIKVYRNTDLGMKLPVYDGRRALYTAGRLPFISKQFTVAIEDDIEWIGITKQREFTVSIEFVAHASMSQLRELLSGKQVDTPSEALKLVDLVLKELTAQRMWITIMERLLPEYKTNPDGIITKHWYGTIYTRLKKEHPHLPCLQVGNQKKVNYMPMEACKIVEGQRRTKGLNNKQITSLLKFSCQRPKEQEKEILQTMHQNGYKDDPYAKEFGITIDETPTSIDARVLPAPWLKYNDSGKQKEVLPQMGQWNMKDKKVINGSVINYWACINFSRTVTDSAAQSDLKRICETDLGLISQCCLTKYVLKISKQYLSNVSLKINVKMGGRNTVLLDALRWKVPLVSDIPTIIFGADVTHPESGEDSNPSIAAVVASQDWPEVTKYAGLVSAQPHRQELIQDLYKTWQDPQRGKVNGGMIRELLLSFEKATGKKPLRIIFYRDGVSDGQFYQVLLYELDAIRKACASLEPNYQPPVTFIVVQKRHHTRLFPSNHNDRKSTDKSGNILPGTVVDTKICHPVEFDFYLCSHAGIQGTSRPAHYHVLWDENNFSADEIQSLTNNLCYTYARCTRSVSVVPPAYYAHLAAYRARFYMEPEVQHDNGSAHSMCMVKGAGVRPLPALKEKVKNVMFYC
ncbi:hypothetical protein M8C21_013165 [Ambrosia artemisiifolia]|uniref:Piwi domain-containing protein n=1 Tax=Ambrosia artemisiifolia TaxID=4212 RepID=A0AAD5G504_AMBAR|nr:hypothetical protein M8C21_013165 [Ambrosia artemisiifolia]